MRIGVGQIAQTRVRGSCDRQNADHPVAEAASAVAAVVAAGSAAFAAGIGRGNLCVTAARGPIAAMRKYASPRETYLTRSGTASVAPGSKLRQRDYRMRMRRRGDCEA